MSRSIVSEINSKSNSISRHFKLQKRETLNLSEEDSVFLIDMLKTLIKNKQLMMSEEKKPSNNNSAFINMPVIQLVIFTNQTNALHESYTENKLNIDQAKSNIFSFLTVFACLLVIKSFHIVLVYFVHFI